MAKNTLLAKVTQESWRNAKILASLTGKKTPECRTILSKNPGALKEAQEAAQNGKPRLVPDESDSNQPSTREISAPGYGPALALQPQINETTRNLQTFLPLLEAAKALAEIGEENALKLIQVFTK